MNGAGTVNCPKCGASVEGGAGFGMLTCPSCGEFILLGQEVPEEKSYFGDMPQDNPQPGITPSAAETLDSAPAPAMATAEAEVEVVFETQQSPAVRENSAPAESMQEVAEFGNATLPSQGANGLVYDLIIEGVDTVEIRDDLEACLTDQRLGLDVTETLGQIKSGVLRLNEMHPVKASVILNRLRHLPFRISWVSKLMVKSAWVALFSTALLFYGALAFLTPTPSFAAGDWAQHEINLKGYATRIRNVQDDLRELIAKKNKNKDPKTRDALLEQIIKKDQELRSVYQDFKDEQEHIRFEYPEQGDESVRKYRHLKLKSLKDLENEVGLDGDLSRIKNKVETTYQVDDDAAAPQKEQK